MPKKEIKRTTQLLTISGAKRIFEMELPAVYNSFIVKGDHTTYSGARLVYSSSSVSDLNTTLRFDNAKEIESMFKGEPFQENDFLYEKKKLAYLPIAKISKGGKSLSFIAINVAKKDKFPVVYIDIGDGEVLKETIAASLKDFLRMLVQKGAADPVKDLKKTLAEANRLFEKENYDKALGLAEEMLAAYQKLDPGRKKTLKELPGIALNYRGLCRQHLGMQTEGLRDLKDAFRAGCMPAGLNVARQLIERKKPEAALKILDKMTWLDDKFYVSYYSGLCYAMLGDEKEATDNFKYLHKEFGNTKPGLIETARDGLKNLEGEISKKILSWFGKKKTIATLSKEQVADNRRWWSSLSSIIRGKMASHSHVDVNTITDDQIYEIIEELEYIVARCPETKNFKPLLRMKSLRSLSLTISSDTPLEQFVQFTGLTKFSLSYSEITDVSSLGKMTWLKKLQLTNNKISDISPLAALSSLEELWLGSNPLENISAIKKMVHVKDLYLSVTKISNLAPLSDLPVLESLSVAFTKITDLMPLAGCPNLKSIDCSDCKELSKDAIKAFKKLRPTIKIDS
jgi:tetratricopeptide (TPR) repeat protein